jgi:hypothetical protein
MAKKIDYIYTYVDGDRRPFERGKMRMLKNCEQINNKQYLFHSDFYDSLRLIDNPNYDEGDFDIIRIGINKSIKRIK